MNLGGRSLGGRRLGGRRSRGAAFLQLRKFYGSAGASPSQKPKPARREPRPPKNQSRAPEPKPRSQQPKLQRTLKHRVGGIANDQMKNRIPSQLVRGTELIMSRQAVLQK